jgi:hypothetical protein
MLQLTDQSALTLPTTAYRDTHPSRWRLFLSCLRHPILAVTAWRQQRREPAFTERQKFILWVALLHGVVAAFLT